jgi:hypothetical protein
MIITEKIQNLKIWLQENRLDKESTKPYFIESENDDGSYSLPQDALIEKGLKELNQPYSIVIDVNGVSIEVESKYFEE